MLKDLLNDLNTQDTSLVFSIIGVILGFIGVRNDIELIWISALIFLIVAIVINILNYRLLRLKEGFSITVFRRHLSGAKKIYILNTFAPNFDKALKDILLKALEDEILIKVLLWNPNCEEVNHRQKTLQKYDIVGYIKQNIEFLQQVYNGAKNDRRIFLQLKLYNSWAPFSLYSTDRGASVGFFMNGQFAVDGPQLIISKNKRYFSKFIDQFDIIWETGKLFNFSKNNLSTILDTEFR